MSTAITMLLGQATGAWDSYGPVGLITAAVLSALGFLYRDKVAREREMDARHAQERENWRKEHREERKEVLTMHAVAWEESRTDMKETHANLSKVIGELTSAVQTVHVDMKAARMLHEDKMRQDTTKS